MDLLHIHLAIARQTLVGILAVREYHTFHRQHLLITHLSTYLIFLAAMPMDSL